ncbi:hypothetical protein F5887DRAFT_342662 [Amanita rubescens]|nr:hypothetical protein F5887DRAFT_342662 [Amanita rubescens]
MSLIMSRSDGNPKFNQPRTVGYVALPVGSGDTSGIAPRCRWSNSNYFEQVKCSKKAYKGQIHGQLPRLFLVLFAFPSSCRSSRMLFRNIFQFLSVLFTFFHTVSAVSVRPLLAARQISPCSSQCSEASDLAYGGNCPITCICTPATLNAFYQCVQCTEAANMPEVVSIQNTESYCAANGYPLTVGSTPSGTGSGSDGGTTAGQGIATSIGITLGEKIGASFGGVAVVVGIIFLLVHCHILHCGLLPFCCN